MHYMLNLILKPVINFAFQLVSKAGGAALKQILERSQQETEEVWAREASPSLIDYGHVEALLGDLREKQSYMAKQGESKLKIYWMTLIEVMGLLIMIWGMTIQNSAAISRSLVNKSNAITVDS